MRHVFRSRFSLRLLLAVAVVTSLLSLSSGIAVYYVARGQQLEALCRSLQTTAQLAASSARRSDVEQLAKDRSEQSEAWKQLASHFRVFQKNDSRVQYIYLMGELPETSSSGVVEFLVDPSLPRDRNGNGVLDPDEIPAHLGDRYNARQAAPEMLRGFETPACDRELTEDRWGVFLSGYAPLSDDAGRVLGLVGVDMSAQQLSALRNAFLLQCALAMVGVIFTSLLISWLLSRHIAGPVAKLEAGMARVEGGDLEARLAISTGDEFEHLSEQFNAMVAGLEERQRLLGSLERYMGKEVADLIVREGLDFGKPRRTRATVLFCDLERMTSWAETLSPEQSARLLSVFIEKMIEAVFRNGGVVDKLLGDGLMALFGVPIELEHQERHAVRCALDMRQAMESVREELGLPELQMGIGIHTGHVVAGNFGSSKLMDYTVLGDAVNVAARLQQVSRDHPGRIATSQVVTDALQAEFEFRSIGPTELRNRREPVITYDVVGPSPDQPSLRPNARSVESSGSE